MTLEELKNSLSNFIQNDNLLMTGNKILNHLFESIGNSITDNLPDDMKHLLKIYYWLGVNINMRQVRINKEEAKEIIQEFIETGTIKGSN